MKKEMNEMKEQGTKSILKMKSLTFQEWAMIAAIILGLYSLIFTNYGIDRSKLVELLVFQSVMVVFFIKRENGREMLTVLFLMTPYIYSRLVVGGYITAILGFVIVGFVFYYVVKTKKVEYVKAFKISIPIITVIVAFYTLKNILILDRKTFIDEFYFMYASGISSFTMLCVFSIMVFIINRKR